MALVSPRKQIERVCCGAESPHLLIRCRQYLTKRRPHHGEETEPMEGAWRSRKHLRGLVSDKLASCQTICGSGNSSSANLRSQSGLCEYLARSIHGSEENITACRPRSESRRSKFRVSSLAGSLPKRVFCCEEFWSGPVHRGVAGFPISSSQPSADNTNWASSHTPAQFVSFMFTQANGEHCLASELITQTESDGFVTVGEN